MKKLVLTMSLAAMLLIGAIAVNAAEVTDEDATAFASNMDA